MNAPTTTTILLHLPAIMLYYICRILQIYRFRFDQETQRLVLRRRHKCLDVFIAILQATLLTRFVMQALTKELVELTVLFIINSDARRLYAILPSAHCQLLALCYIVKTGMVYGSYRIFATLCSAAEEKFIVRLINEALELRVRVRRLSGADLSIPSYWVPLLCAKICLLVWYYIGCRKFHKTDVYTPLFELCYYAFQSMQFVLFGLHRNLNDYTERSLHAGGNCQATKCTLQRVTRLLDRLRELQRHLVQHYAWFALLIYWSNVICSFNIFNMANTIVSPFSSPWEKLFLLFYTTLAPVLVPWINVISVGTLNDCLWEEVKRTQDLFVIAALRMPHRRHCAHCRKAVRMLALVSFKQKLQPLHVYFVQTVKIDRSFAFVFMANTLLSALTYFQYYLANTVQIEQETVYII